MNFKKLFLVYQLLKNLIETGYTGRKGKGGFYRMNKSENKKILEALNLNKNEYFPVKKDRFEN